MSKISGRQYEGVHIGKIPLFSLCGMFSMMPACRGVGPGKNDTGGDPSQAGWKGENSFVVTCRPICRPCAARWGGSHLGISSPPGWVGVGGVLGHPYLVNDMGEHAVTLSPPLEFVFFYRRLVHCHIKVAIQHPRSTGTWEPSVIGISAEAFCGERNPFPERPDYGSIATHFILFYYITAQKNLVTR